MIGVVNPQVPSPLCISPLAIWTHGGNERPGKDFQTDGQCGNVNLCARRRPPLAKWQSRHHIEEALKSPFVVFFSLNHHYYYAVYITYCAYRKTRMNNHQLSRYSCSITIMSHHPEGPPYSCRVSLSDWRLENDHLSYSWFTDCCQIFNNTSRPRLSIVRFRLSEELISDFFSFVSRPHSDWRYSIDNRRVKWTLCSLFVVGVDAVADFL